MEWIQSAFKHKSHRVFKKLKFYHITWCVTNHNISPFGFKQRQRQKLFLRHLILFCCGFIIGSFYVQSIVTDLKAYLEFRTSVYKEINFHGFNNQEPMEGNQFLIPNYVHYIRLDLPELRFFEAVCMKSVFLIQRPERIYLHTNTPKLKGRYWDMLLDIPGFRESLIVKEVTMPEKIFGVEFFWNAHKADVLRILILKKYGGMYLDNDVYLTNSLDEYRRYEFTLGWPEGEWIGNMILMANKDARFLLAYLDTYKLFRPDVWYYNGGEKPVREVLSLYPDLVHNEQVRLGVTTNIAWFFYVQKNLWNPDDWQNNYDSIHLLIGHRNDIDPRFEECTEFTEENIKWLDMSVALMFRYVWFGTMRYIDNNTDINMEQINRAWIESKGSHVFMRSWDHQQYGHLPMPNF